MDKKEIIKAIENSYKYTSEGFLIDYNILADKILALSLPKEVDLEELRDEWIYYANMPVNDKIKYFNWFTLRLPHLQKPVESEWIRVEDRLPEITGFPYLILHEDFMITAYFHIDPNDNEPWWEAEKTITAGVTHWMPLPQPPKNNSNN